VADAPLLYVADGKARHQGAPDSTPSIAAGNGPREYFLERCRAKYGDDIQRCCQPRWLRDPYGSRGSSSGARGQWAPAVNFNIT